ncbi:hypothetical protein DFQ26_005141 [Actinomortierella ambigua]|nr:hypothetical protein DFQ26_005141 [Actinomortierella ambigua]
MQQDVQSCNAATAAPAPAPGSQLPPLFTRRRFKAPKYPLWAVKQQRLAAKTKTSTTWATLIEAALRKIRKEEISDKAALDRLDQNGMSQSERHLLRILRRLVVDDNEGRLGKDDVKDLMVAMSGIIDLRTWEMRRPPSLIQADLMILQRGLSELLASLEGPSQIGTRLLILRCQCLIGKFADAELKGEKPSPFKGMIRVIEYLATMVDNESTPCSEQEWVDTWKEVLNCLTDGSIRLISGKTVCKATVAAKKEIKEAFGIEFENCGGSKCDLLMQVGDMETLNSGVKVFEEGDVVEAQYKKNLLVNCAIWRQAAEKGVELPAMMMLDLQGRSGLIVRMEPARDCPSIFYAGIAHEEVINLPTSQTELREFMVGPAPFLLFNYASWLVSYGRAIRVQLTAQPHQRMTVLGKRNQVSDDNTDTEADTGADTDTNAGADASQESS